MRSGIPRRIASGWVRATVLLLAGCAGAAGPVALPGESARLRKPVVSWLELHNRHIVFQDFDYSCGAAALATLMRYYFQDDVSEADVLQNILVQLTNEDTIDREKEGLSLLDLKGCAERMGYQAAGVKLSGDMLPTLRGPVLVHVVRDGYRHFAVFRGVREDRVYLADPSLGNVRMSIERFAEEWSGVALILGKEGFGLPDTYPLAVEEEPPIRHELQAVRRALDARLTR